MFSKVLPPPPAEASVAQDGNGVEEIDDAGQKVFQWCQENDFQNLRLF